MIEKERGFYLYCFAFPGLVGNLKKAGVDSQFPPFVYDLDGFSSVVSEVMISDFCGPTAESMLKDLAFVGPRACRHDAVILDVMSCSSVLPVQFGTIFYSLNSLRQTVNKYRESIQEFLEWVADKEEWGVKGFLAEQQARKVQTSSILDPHKETLSSLTPGKRYIEEKRLVGNIDERLKVWLNEVASELTEKLENFSSDFVERKVLLESEQHNGKGKMVWNWAFLLPKDVISDFQVQIEKSNSMERFNELNLEISGPWPPYSFTPKLSLSAED